MGHHFLAIAPAGLDKNPQLLQLLTKLKRTWKEREREVRWVRPELWHVTLAFLGHLRAGDQLRLTQILEDWTPSASDLQLELTGVGAFPSVDQARVLWIGVHASQEFLNLQQELSELLTANQLTIEEREYKPHLTLARFRNANSVHVLTELGGRKHFGEYEVAELILFESVLEGNIIKYVPQWRKPLRRQ